jgi:L-fuculose-phosphate aldolase
MIDETEAREALCEIGRRVWQRGYVAANDGNFSLRLDEHRVLCTPTMMSKGFMEPEDMVIADLDGNKISGRRDLTSEIRVHLNIYRHRPRVGAVVHVHPPHATAFAITGRPLPKCVLPEIEFNIGEVPLVPYVTAGTWDFAHSIDPWVHHYDCFLLANHGAITLGQDPFDAYYRMETLDQYCRILLLAEPLGPWRRISDEAMRDLMNLKRARGMTDARFGREDHFEPDGEPAILAPPPPSAEPFVPPAGPLTDEPKFGPHIPRA